MLQHRYKQCCHHCQTSPSKQSLCPVFPKSPYSDKNVTHSINVRCHKNSWSDRAHHHYSHCYYHHCCHCYYYIFKKSLNFNPGSLWYSEGLFIPVWCEIHQSKIPGVMSWQLTNIGDWEFEHDGTQGAFGKSPHFLFPCKITWFFLWRHISNTCQNPLNK